MTGKHYFIASLVMILSAMTNVTFAAEKKLSFELNKAQLIQDKCRVTFVASNGLGLVVDKTALEVVVFNDKKIVSEILVLDFGRLPVAKTKVIQFDLAATCGGISRLLINDFTECSIDGAPSSTCLDIVQTSSRTEILFGF